MKASEQLQERLKEIEEICSMYDGEEPGWLAEMKHNLADIDHYTAAGIEVADISQPKNPNMPLLPQFFQSLHTCLLNQRWLEAVRILQKIVQVPVGSSSTIWKVGKELMEHDPENCDRLLKDLFSKIKGLPDINHREVILEYALYLLTTGDSRAATETIQEHIVKSGLKKEDTDRDKYIEVLFRANTGLLWYLEWEKCGTRLLQIQHQQSTGEPLTSSMSLTTGLEMQRNNFAVKAIKSFEGLTAVPGVWDIFVDKYVKLLLHSDKNVEALEVLQEFSVSNESNPNAQKYLYHFYKDHFPESDNALKQLKVVAALVPSDSLVLELCDILARDQQSEMLVYLFDLLDHARWQTEVRPWQMLADTLVGLSSSRLEEKTDDMCQLKACWAQRHSWWPHYHFHPTVVVKQPAVAINYFKALVACCLCGSDNLMCIEAQKQFSDEQMKDYMVLKQQFKRFRECENILPP